MLLTGLVIVVTAALGFFLLGLSIFILTPQGNTPMAVKRGPAKPGHRPQPTGHASQHLPLPN